MNERRKLNMWESLTASTGVLLALSGCVAPKEAPPKPIVVPVTVDLLAGCNVTEANGVIIDSTFTSRRGSTDRRVIFSRKDLDGESIDVVIGETDPFTYTIKLNSTGTGSAPISVFPGAPEKLRDNGNCQ